MKRRMFTAVQKTTMVLEVLQSDEDLTAIATRNQIAPNQLRNWRNDFLKRASIIFDEKRDEKYKLALQEKTEQVDQLYKIIGQLTSEVDWLKKKIGQYADFK